MRARLQVQPPAATAQTTTSFFCTRHSVRATAERTQAHCRPSHFCCVRRCSNGFALLILNVRCSPLSPAVITSNQGRSLIPRAPVGLASQATGKPRTEYPPAHSLCVHSSSFAAQVTHSLIGLVSFIIYQQRPLLALTLDPFWSTLTMTVLPLIGTAYRVYCHLSSFSHHAILTF